MALPPADAAAAAAPSGAVVAAAAAAAEATELMPGTIDLLPARRDPPLDPGAGDNGGSAAPADDAPALYALLLELAGGGG